MIYSNASMARVDLFPLTMNGPEADLTDTRRHVAWVILGCTMSKECRLCAGVDNSEGRLLLHVPVLPFIMDNPLHHREDDVTIDIMNGASTPTLALGTKMKKMRMGMRMTRTGSGKTTDIPPQTAFMTSRTASV